MHVQFSSITQAPCVPFLVGVLHYLCTLPENQGVWQSHVCHVAVRMGYPIAGEVPRASVGWGASKSQSTLHMHILVCMCSNVRWFHKIIGMIHVCRLGGGVHMRRFGVVGPSGAIWVVGGGGGAQAPLTSPCPRSNPTITINLTLTFATNWFGHDSHVDWAKQNPPNFVHGCFCHIIALHLDPNTHSNPSQDES